MPDIFIYLESAHITGLLLLRPSMPLYLLRFSSYRHREYNIFSGIFAPLFVGHFTIDLIAASRNIRLSQFCYTMVIKAFWSLQNGSKVCICSSFWVTGSYVLSGTRCEQDTFWAVAREPNDLEKEFCDQNVPLVICNKISKRNLFWVLAEVITPKVTKIRRTH